MHTIFTCEEKPSNISVPLMYYDNFVIYLITDEYC